MKLTYKGRYSSVIVDGVTMKRNEASEVPDELGARLLKAEEKNPSPEFVSDKPAATSAKPGS